MPTYEITFSIEVEKEVTKKEITNWAENVIKDFEEKEKNSNSSIGIINIETILED